MLMRDIELTSPNPGSSETAASRSSPLDAAAFTVEFRKAYRVLWLIAMGVLADRHLAEDAVQEAVIVGLRKLGQFEPGTNYIAWMGQIVRHTALNQRRKQHRRAAVSLESGLEPGGSPRGAAPDVSDKPAVDLKGQMRNETQHFDDRLLAGLRSLGEVARACLLLRTIEGLDYKEISRLLDIPPNTAMSHVYRSRQTLRQMLADGSNTGLDPVRSTP